jgi:transposase-like protein
MAGRPRTKARREAETRSGTRFDRPARVAILKRSDEIGAAAAAKEAGVAVGTLRTWRKRLAEEPSPSPPLSTTPATDDAGEPQSRAEQLRAAADKARDASSRALDQADSMLQRGLASEARNAAVVSGTHADRASQLESAAREEEAHQVALTEARGRLVLEVIERGYGDLRLLMPRTFLQALLRGWPEAVDAEIVLHASEEVRRPIRAEIRAALIAELEAERLARPALTAGKSEEDDEPIADAEIVGSQ